MKKSGADQPRRGRKRRRGNVPHDPPVIIHDHYHSPMTNEVRNYLDTMHQQTLSAIKQIKVDALGGVVDQLASLASDVATFNDHIAEVHRDQLRLIALMEALVSVVRARTRTAEGSVRDDAAIPRGLSPDAQLSASDEERREDSDDLFSVERELAKLNRLVQGMGSGGTVIGTPASPPGPSTVKSCSCGSQPVGFKGVRGTLTSFRRRERGRWTGRTRSFHIRFSTAGTSRLWGCTKSGLWKSRAWPTSLRTSRQDGFAVA